MHDRTTPASQAAIAKFRERYTKIIHNQSITELSNRWYVLRAQAYIDAYPSTRRKEHPDSNLTNYLNALGRTLGLKDWQFRQSLNAIRILLVDLAGLEWGRSFDWDYWRDSAQSLQVSYPTVARDYEPHTWNGTNTDSGECHEIKVKHEKFNDSDPLFPRL